MLTAGYFERLGVFSKANSADIVKNPKTFIQDVDDSQVRAWRDSIKILKEALDGVISHYPFVAEKKLYYS